MADDVASLIEAANGGHATALQAGGSDTIFADGFDGP
jgi:hypothetical protein